MQQNETDACKNNTSITQQDQVPPRKKQKRSIDFLLEGQSVHTNARLSRFARAPFLDAWRNDPSCSSLLNRKSKSLRKEIIEAYAVVEQIEKIVQNKSDPIMIIDVCSGKGFFSLLAAHEFPNSYVLMIDKDTRMDVQHIESRTNMHLWRIDIMVTTNLNDRLRGEIRHIQQKQERNTVVVMVGMHLCGDLSPRAVELFGQLMEDVHHLILAPCCLHKIHDSALKQKAKADGIDPYQAKVEALCQMTCQVVGEELNENNANGLMSLCWDETFRTNRSSVEGSKTVKNAIIVATKPKKQEVQNPDTRREELSP